MTINRWHIGWGDPKHQPHPFKTKQRPACELFFYIWGLCPSQTPLFLNSETANNACAGNFWWDWMNWINQYPNTSLYATLPKCSTPIALSIDWYKPRLLDKSLSPLWWDSRVAAVLSPGHCTRANCWLPDFTCRARMSSDLALALLYLTTRDY